jgi:hypothetical protein
MKSLAKIALLAAATVGLSSGPAYSQKISPYGLGTAVTASGTIEVSVFGIGRRTCGIVMNGTVTRVGSNSPAATGEMTFTSGTATGTNCTSTGTGSTIWPVKIETTLPSTQFTKVRITQLSFSTPIGPCTTTNTLIDWNNAISTAFTTSAVTVGFCTVHTMNVVLSPAMTIL